MTSQESSPLPSSNHIKKSHKEGTYSMASYTSSSPSNVSLQTEDGSNSSNTAAANQVSIAGDSNNVVNKSSTSNNGAVETQVYSRRWAILILFSFTLLVNQAQYCSFATINRETMDYFETSNLGATMLTAVYSAVYVVFIVPMCIFYDKLGFYDGMLLTGAANVLCGGFKFIGAFQPNYAWIMIGQIFGGLAQLFSLSVPPLLAAIWFPTEERSLATSLGTLSGFLGIAYSFYFSPVIIDNTPDKTHFGVLLGSTFAAASLFFILCLIIVKDKPPKPPSVTARAESGMPSAPREVFALFCKQLSNFSLMRLWVGFGFANGTVTALSTVLSTMLLPYGISEGRTGVIVSVAILAGCIAAPIVALSLDKYRNYKMMLIGLYTFSTLTIVGAALVITFDIEYLYTAAFILIVLNQITLLPAIPVAMEFSVEKTYPDPEVVGSSLCLVHLCIFAVLGSVIFSAILGDESTKDEAVICIWTCVGVIGMALLLAISVREDRFRHGHELRFKEGEEENSLITPVAAE